MVATESHTSLTILVEILQLESCVYHVCSRRAREGKSAADGYRDDGGSVC